MLYIRQLCSESDGSSVIRRENRARDTVVQEAVVPGASRGQLQRDLGLPRAWRITCSSRYRHLIQTLGCQVATRGISRRHVASKCCDGNVESEMRPMAGKRCGRMLIGTWVRVGRGHIIARAQHAHSMFSIPQHNREQNAGKHRWVERDNGV